MSARFRQDMPPPGGYSSVQWAKVARKAGVNGYKFFGIVAAMMSVGIFSQHFDVKRKKAWQLESLDAEIALEPLLKAERDRAFLRQLRANRDYENEVMADVPGWVTGTLWGDPVYHGVAGRFPDVSPTEYYMHNSDADLYDRISERWNH